MSKKENQGTLVPTSNVTFRDQVRVVRAYVILSDGGSTSVHYKDVMRITRLGKTQISGLNSFMEMLGLLEKVNRGSFKPTEAAIDLCNCKPQNEDFSVISSELKQSRLFTNIDQYLRVHGGPMSQGLIDYIMEESGSKDSSRVASALDWFIEARLIESNSEEDAD